MRLAVVGVLLAGSLQAYPLDGAASTGIRRLTGYRLVNEGKIKGAVKLPPGAMLRSDQIALSAGAANEIASTATMAAAVERRLDSIVLFSHTGCSGRPPISGLFAQLSLFEGN